MMENDIVIQNEQIQYEHESIDNQYYDNSRKPCFTCFLVVIVQFEYFSFGFSHGDVDDHD